MNEKTETKKYFITPKQLSQFESFMMRCESNISMVPVFHLLQDCKKTLNVIKLNQFELTDYLETIDCILESELQEFAENHNMSIDYLLEDLKRRNWIQSTENVKGKCWIKPFITEERIL